MIGRYGILSHFSANLAASRIQYAKRVKGDPEITRSPSYCRVMEAQHRRVGRFSRTERMDRKGVSLSSLTHKQDAAARFLRRQTEWTVQMPIPSSARTAARQRLGIASAALMMIAGFASCSAAPQAAAPATSMSASTEPTPTSVMTPVGSSESPSPAPVETTEPTEDPAGTPGPTVLSGGERTLGMADAFNPSSNWEEKNYRPVGSPSQVQAIGVHVQCNDNDPEILEFRFSNTNGFKLKASVAQDLFSPEAAAQVQFTLRVDGRQIATKTIKLKESAELETDLTGVAVAQLEVSQLRDPVKGCGDESIALITKLAMSSS